jgi:hypothetical protein
LIAGNLQFNKVNPVKLLDEKCIGPMYREAYRKTGFAQVL